jgi:uncharacterized protein (TIGR03435 family)
MRLVYLFMRMICRVGPALFVAGMVFGQTGPQFEVASVKPSAPDKPEQVSLGAHIDGARFVCNYFSLRDYIRLAYRVKDYQVVSPEWMGTERYDVAATLPPGGASQDQVWDMMKALLADRFQLKLHHETKEFPVYALILAKGGTKLKESPLDPETDATAKPAVNVTANGSRNGVAVNLGHGAFFNFSNNKLEAKKLTMSYFAEMLARFVDRPVVDMTGLTGTYDVLLNFTEEDYRAMLIRSAINAGVVLPPQARQAMEAASGDSITSAMQAAGLKLEARKAPMDVLVIDHAEKTPSAN